MFTGTDFPDLFTTTDGVFGLGVNYWDTPYNGLMDDLGEWKPPVDVVVLSVRFFI